MAAPRSASLLEAFAKAHAALTSVKTVRPTTDNAVNGKTETYVVKEIIV